MQASYYQQLKVVQQALNTLGYNMLRILFKSLIIVTLSMTMTAYSESKPQPVKIKVMSYNIRHGANMQFKMNLEKQAEIIKKQNADFVGLQEVENKCSRSGNVDQIQKLGLLTNIVGTFGRFMDYQGGQYGMGTLCELPLVEAIVLNIPRAKLEARCAIINVAQLPNGKKITFVNLHLDWLKDQVQNRINQAKSILKEVDRLALPTVILGDFNCTPDSKTMKYFASQGFVFMEKGKDNLTYQGTGVPTVEIDHVIYRSTKKTTLQGLSIDVLDEPQASDHRPIVAEILVK